MIHARPDYNRIQDPERKIPEDEPVFLIRAQDVTAAHVVGHWANMNDEAGGDPILSEFAREHVKRILEWQASNGTKPADYYTGTVLERCKVCDVEKGKSHKVSCPFWGIS